MSIISRARCLLCEGVDSKYFWFNQVRQKDDDVQDNTPLHMAAANGHADTVDRLMLLRADPRATNSQVCDLALLQNLWIGGSAELSAM